MKGMKSLRMFSLIGRIKTNSSLKSQLNMLSLLAIELELVQYLDFDDLVYYLCEEKSQNEASGLRQDCLLLSSEVIQILTMHV